MKKATLTLATTLIMSGALYAQNVTLQDGWQLLGATDNVNLTSLNSNTCADYIWKFNASSQSWELHIANNLSYNYTGTTITDIQAGEGFWVKATGTCNIELSTMTSGTAMDFTLEMLEGNTFYAATKPAGVSTEDPYTSIATFHDDGTRSFSKNSGDDSPADYEITADGDLHVFNTLYDLKFEMISSTSSTGATISANVYKMINGMYELVGERAFFSTQAGLDAFVAIYYPQTNELNLTTEATTTLALGSFTSSINLENDSNDYYNTMSFDLTNLTFSAIDYENYGTAWTQEDTFGGSLVTNSNGTVTISESGGFVADINLTKTEKVLTVNGNAVTDLFISDVELTVTSVGTPWTDDWEWTPKDSNGDNITTNQGLKEMFLTQDNWIGGDTYAMLSGVTTATSGDVVKGVFSSYWENCTPTTDNDCKHITRTSEVIGSWSFDTITGIFVDTPQETNTLSISTTGTVQSIGNDKVGSVWHEKWLTGTGATQAITQELLAP